MPMKGVRLKIQFKRHNEFAGYMACVTPLTSSCASLGVIHH